MRLKSSRGFTPLNPKGSGFQVEGERSLSSKPDTSPVFRGGDLTGFTMIESLIVVALILVFGVIALLNLGPRKQTKEFEATVTRVVHILETARNKAVNFEGGEKWYVILMKKSCPTYPFSTPPLPGGVEGVATFFKSVPSIVGSVQDNYFLFPPSVSFYEPSTFDGSSGCPQARYFYFAGLTGKPGDSASNLNFSFKMYLVVDPKISSTISISSVGLISYSTSSLLSF